MVKRYFVGGAGWAGWLTEVTVLGQTSFWLQWWVGAGAKNIQVLSTPESVEQFMDGLDQECISDFPTEPQDADWVFVNGEGWVYGE